MFKHMLLPTDGSAISESAVRTGVDLARSLGARVTGLHVIPPFHVLTSQVAMLEDARAEYERESMALAIRHLEFIVRTAASHAVACDTLTESGGDVYQSILDVARTRGCDLIVMASHGRRGIAGILIGSQTQHVLTHARVPVLVCR
jgi:nucleotide-binding universal stress UspA family protein